MENVSGFLAPLFSRGSGVAAEVVDEDAAEFVGKGLSDAVGGVAVDEGSVGNECDDAVVLDAVGGPADAADIGVIQAVLVGAAGQLRVGLRNGCIQNRVLLVLVVIVRA